MSAARPPIAIAAVMLAAGASSRMGEHKLLLDLAGAPLARRPLETLAGLRLEPLVVVLGRDAELVREALAGLGARFALNAGYAEGIASSFRVGAAALAGLPLDAALFALADQPFVTADHLVRLLAAFSEGRQAIVASRHGSDLVPPHLVRRDLLAEVAAEGLGVKRLHERHARDATAVEIAADELLDVDGPDDYRRALAVSLRSRRG